MKATPHVPKRDIVIARNDNRRLGDSAQELSRLGKLPFLGSLSQIARDDHKARLERPDQMQERIHHFGHDGAKMEIGNVDNADHGLNGQSLASKFGCCATQRSSNLSHPRDDDRSGTPLLVSEPACIRFPMGERNWRGGPLLPLSVNSCS